MRDAAISATWSIVSRCLAGPPREPAECPGAECPRALACDHRGNPSAVTMLIGCCFGHFGREGHGVPQLAALQPRLAGSCKRRGSTDIHMGLSRRNGRDC